MARETNPRAGAETSVDARFECMFRATAPRVEAYVRRRVTAACVDDVVAETYLTAWRRLDELRGDPLPWLLGVARRAISTQSRSRRRQDALVERIAFDVPAAFAAEPSPPSAVFVALAQLEDADREALLLIAWDGLTPAQAAVVLDVSAVAFRVRLHRAKRRFAERLERAASAEAAAPADLFPKRSIRCAPNA